MAYIGSTHIREHEQSIEFDHDIDVHKKIILLEFNPTNPYDCLVYIDGTPTGKLEVTRSK